MKVIIRYILLILPTFCFSQTSISELLSEDVPSIKVTEVSSIQNQIIFLDARDLREFEVSHLKDAIWVGHSEFSIEKIENIIPNKSTSVVVYCSLGIRSEDITRKLRRAGYTNAKNLYGGIFEWKNNDFEVYNTKRKATDSIHVFSEYWSKWLKKGVKVYD